MSRINKNSMIFRSGAGPHNLGQPICEMPIVLELASKIFAGLYAVSTIDSSVAEMYDCSFALAEELIEEYNKRYEVEGNE